MLLANGDSQFSAGAKLDSWGGADPAFDPAHTITADDGATGDLAIGAPDDGAGKAYVAFGDTFTHGGTLNLSSLNGTNGFRVFGKAGEIEISWVVDQAA